MAKSDSEDPYRSDLEVSAGTHPLAMVCIVGGLVSVAAGACCLLHPIFAVAGQGGAGLAALVSGLIVQIQISRGRYGPTNRFQVRIGLATGTVGLISAVVWAVVVAYQGVPAFPG